MNNPPYVHPDFTIHDSFKELEDYTPLSAFSFDQPGNGFEFKGFYHHRRAFILAEPGYGKSRVIQEIVAQADDNNCQAAMVSFSQLDSLSLEDLEKELNERKLQNTQCSENFSLTDDATVILCLDALDEVGSFKFTSALQLIGDISRKYPAISLYVSCRTHYVADKRYDFNQFTGFCFIRIASLDSRQIRDFLHNGLDETPDKEPVVSGIIKQSYGYDKVSVFSVPRYLLAFAKAVNSRKFTQERLLQLRRADIFDIAIYEKLEREAQQQNNEVVVVKRVLEKLALVMEIAQTNQIAREELITFLDRVQSNVNQALFSLCRIDIFIERVLKRTGDTLEFDNTEFQEYLAAKELLRLGERDQILHDLIVEPTFLHIYSNWYDVLRYAVELEPKTILPIVSFIGQKGGHLVEDKYFDLLDIVDSQKLSEEEKQRIFETFYQYFQRSSQYVGYHAEIISKFYSSASYITCLANEPDTFEIKARNQIAVVRTLAELGHLNIEQQSIWKQRLVNQAKQNGKELQILSTSALGYFEDVEPLKQLKETVFNTDDYDLQNEYIRACAQAGADHKFSLEILMEGFRRKRKYADTYVQKVQKSSSLHFIIDNFLGDISLLADYYGGSNELGGFNNFLYQLNEDLFEDDKDELIKKLKKLLKALLSKAQQNHFYGGVSEAFLRIAEWLIRQESRFLFTFLGWFPNNNFLDDNVEKLFAKVLRPAQVKSFVKMFSGRRHGSWEISAILSVVDHSENPAKSAIKQKTQQYHPELYKNQEEKQVANQGEKAYEEFKSYLEPIAKFNLFSLYLNNKEFIESRATAQEMARLKSIVADIFKQIEANRISRLNNSTANGNHPYFTNSQMLWYFPDILQTALALDLEVEPYRKLLICLVPLLHNEGTTTVLQHLGSLQDNEKQAFVSFYEKVSLDNIAFEFTRTVTNLKLLAFIPVFKDLFASSQADFLLKREIIRCTGQLQASEEKEFLNDIFQRYGTGSEEQNQLAEIANEYLISQLKDQAAINWRFDQLKMRKEAFHYPRSEYGGVRGVSNLEAEFDNLDFAKCLLSLSDSTYTVHFLDILAFSLEECSDPNFIAYRNYLQKTVHAYYTGLRPLRKNYLHEIRKLMSEYDNSAAGSFGRYIRDLELKYAGEQKKTIHQSANIYNQLQAKTYEPIHHPIELLHTILDVVRNEVTEEIQQSGLYAPIQKLVNGKQMEEKDPDINEDLIQKMLKLSLENNLQKRGFRGTDIHREVELYDGKRYDFLIKYGFVGPIVVEIKLEDNSEITSENERKKYKQKMQQYLQANSTKLGLYIVFKVKPNRNNPYENLRQEYSDVKGLYIEQIDCTKSFSK